VFRHLTILLLTLLIFLIYPLPVLASHQIFMKDEELKSKGFSSYEKINPNLQIYPAKRTVERLKLLLIFNPEEKKNYYFRMFENRFNELVYIINNNKTGFLLETVDRYNSFVGDLKIKNTNLDPKSKDKIANYLKILERLRDRYNSSSPYWAKIQQAVDTTRSLI